MPEVQAQAGRALGPDDGDAPSSAAAGGASTPSWVWWCAEARDDEVVEGFGVLDCRWGACRALDGVQWRPEDVRLGGLGWERW